MRLPGEIARFKVFPDQDAPHYWTVLVFAHKGFMRRAFHRLNPMDDGDDRFAAIVMPRERRQLIRGRWRTIDPSLGYALFNRTQLCAEALCHEAVHMVFAYVRRVGQYPRLRKETDEGEEDLAYCAGWCADQLNNGFHKFHCYRK